MSFVDSPLGCHGFDDEVWNKARNDYHKLNILLRSNSIHSVVVNGIVYVPRDLSGKNQVRSTDDRQVISTISLQERLITAINQKLKS